MIDPASFSNEGKYKLPSVKGPRYKSLILLVLAGIAFVFWIMLSIKAFIVAVEWLPDSLSATDRFQGMRDWEAYESEKTDHIVEAMQQAGDVAYLCYIAVPEYGIEDPVPWVFVPVEIDYEDDERFDVEVTLLPNKGEVDDVLLGGSAAVYVAESRGYLNLSRAVSEVHYSYCGGSRWVLFPFLIDTSSLSRFLDPCVNFKAINDEGFVVKSFSYEVKEVDLPELESIARAERG